MQCTERGHRSMDFSTSSWPGFSKEPTFEQQLRKDMGELWGQASRKNYSKCNKPVVRPCSSLCLNNKETGPDGGGSRVVKGPE
jgi:hypothetical protein